GQLPTAASRSPRLRGKAEIGEYFDAAFDHAFQGVRQPHAALSDAMARADGLLREKASAER
ncbi:ABC transporter substrate-binding protein, partial [Methylobacterium hispanicum]